MPDLPDHVERYLQEHRPSYWIAKGSPWERLRGWLQRTIGWP